MKNFGVFFFVICILKDILMKNLTLQPGDIDKKYGGLLEKKWTSVIRLQKKVCTY